MLLIWLGCEVVLLIGWMWNVLFEVGIVMSLLECSVERNILKYLEWFKGWLVMIVIFFVIWLLMMKVCLVIFVVLVMNVWILVLWMFSVVWVCVWVVSVMVRMDVRMRFFMGCFMREVCCIEEVIWVV